MIKVSLETDSVSGRGMSVRLGAAKVRHVDVEWLWVHGVFQRREAEKTQEPASKQTM